MPHQPDPEHSRRSREGALKRVAAVGGDRVAAPALKALARIRATADRIDPDRRMTPQERFAAARIVIANEDDERLLAEMNVVREELEAGLAGRRTKLEQLTAPLVAA